MHAVKVSPHSVAGFLNSFSLFLSPPGIGKTSSQCTSGRLYLLHSVQLWKESVTLEGRHKCPPGATDLQTQRFIPSFPLRINFARLPSINFLHRQEKNFGERHLPFAAQKIGIPGRHQISRLEIFRRKSTNLKCWLSFRFRSLQTGISDRGELVKNRKIAIPAASPDCRPAFGKRRPPI